MRQVDTMVGCYLLHRVVRIHCGKWWFPFGLRFFLLLTILLDWNFEWFYLGSVSLDAQCFSCLVGFSSCFLFMVVISFVSKFPNQIVTPMVRSDWNCHLMLCAVQMFKIESNVFSGRRFTLLSLVLMACSWKWASFSKYPFVVWGYRFLLWD